MGDIKVGPCDIDRATAAHLREMPNPDRRSNADAVRPWVDELDFTRRPREMWIVDLGVGIENSTDRDARDLSMPDP